MTVFILASKVIRIWLKRYTRCYRVREIQVRLANDTGLRLAWVIAYSHRHRDTGRVYTLRTESKRRITAIT